MPAPMRSQSAHHALRSSSTTPPTHPRSSVVPAYPKPIAGRTLREVISRDHGGHGLHACMCQGNCARGIVFGLSVSPCVPSPSFTCSVSTSARAACSHPARLQCPSRSRSSSPRSPLRPACSCHPGPTCCSTGIDVAVRSRSCVSRTTVSWS